MQDDSLKSRLKYALKQSTLIAGCICVCFLLMNFALNGFLITGLAASTFIAFVFPRAESARPRYLIGGYVCGIVSGLVANLICDDCLIVYLPDPMIATVISCVLAVFLTSFFMMTFRMQHPPAAAMSAAVVIDENPLYAAWIALACIGLITLIKELAIRYNNKKEEKEEDGNDETAGK